VERINFASQQIGDANKPGIRAMIARIGSDSGGASSPENLVDACLDQIGALSVDAETRKVLVAFAAKGGSSDADPATARQHIADVLQMVASTQEFQRS